MSDKQLLRSSTFDTDFPWWGFFVLSCMVGGVIGGLAGEDLLVSVVMIGPAVFALGALVAGIFKLHEAIQMRRKRQEAKVRRERYYGKGA